MTLQRLVSTFLLLPRWLFFFFLLISIQIWLWSVWISSTFRESFVFLFLEWIRALLYKRVIWVRFVWEIWSYPSQVCEGCNIYASWHVRERIATQSAGGRAEVSFGIKYIVVVNFLFTGICDCNLSDFYWMYIFFVTPTDAI